MSDTPGLPKDPKIPSTDDRLRSAMAAPAAVGDPAAPTTVWDEVRVEAHRRRATDRRRTNTLRVAAAVVLVIGAVSTVRLIDRRSADEVKLKGADEQRPWVVTDQLMAWDWARTSADGRQLVVAYTNSTSPDTPVSGPCWSGAEPSVVEDGSSVVLSLHMTKARDGGTENVACKEPGFSHSVTVPLGAPLGARALVDASSGRTEPVFDGSKLFEATYLPPGFSRVGDGPYPRERSTGIPVWSVSYGEDGPSGGRLFVTFRYPATEIGPPDSIESSMGTQSVHGLSAELAFITTDGRPILRWIEDGVHVEIKADPGFSHEELLRFAEGLQREGASNTTPGTSPVPGTVHGTAPPGPSVDTPIAIEAAYTSADVLTLVFSGPSNQRIAACSGVFLAEIEDSTGVLRITMSSRSVASGSEHELRGVCPKPGFTSSVAIDVHTSMVGRSFVDGVSGETVPIYDGSTLLTATAPSGTLLVRERGAIGPSADFWMRMYGSDLLAPIVVFEVRQSLLSMPDLLVDTPITGSASVHGLPADLLQDPISSQRSVRWQEGDRRISVTSVPSPQHPDGLTDAELLAIAEGLRAPTP